MSDSVVSIKAEKLESVCREWIDKRKAWRDGMREAAIVEVMKPRWWKKDYTRQQAANVVDNELFPDWNWIGRLLDSAVEIALECAVASKKNGSGFVSVEGWLVTHLEGLKE